MGEHCYPPTIGSFRFLSVKRFYIGTVVGSTSLAYCTASWFLLGQNLSLTVRLDLCEATLTICPKIFFLAKFIISIYQMGVIMLCEVGIK